LDETRFSSQLFHSIAEFAAQMRERVATDVAQLDTVEWRPEPFGSVQVGGIGGEAFEVNPLGGAIRQECLDDTAAVNGRAIPDDHHAAGDLALPVLDQRDHVVRIEGVVWAMEGHVALRQDGADRRELIAGAPLPEEGRLPDRCLAAHNTG